MQYEIETQFPNSESWHKVIDLNKSKTTAVTKLFESELQANAYAEKYVPKSHTWRVVEHEAE